MLKQFVFVVAIAVWTCVVASPLMAQSKEEGMKLVDQAETLRQRAQSKEDLQRAVEKYGQALGIFERISEKMKSESPEIDKGKATALNGLGLIYCSRGEYKKADECLNKAKGLLEDDNATKVWEIEHNIGKLYHEWGREIEALEFLEPALDFRKQLGDLKGQADTLEALAVLDICGSMYGVAHARSNLEQTLDIRRKMGDLRGEGITLNILGIFYRLTGEPDKAREYIEKALKIAEETENASGRADALDNLGNVCMNLGEYVRAAEKFDKALATRIRLGEAKSEANTLTNLGHVYMALGKPEKALIFWNRGLQILLKIGVPSESPGYPVKKRYSPFLLGLRRYGKSSTLSRDPGEPQKFY